jgi:hypothetical protein
VPVDPLLAHGCQNPPHPFPKTLVSQPVQFLVRQCWFSSSVFDLCVLCVAHHMTSLSLERIS